jgi:hypothetical protein
VESTRVAIECLTLWMEPGDDARVGAIKHIERLAHDARNSGADQIIYGLLDLSTILVQFFARSEALGNDFSEEARLILQRISPWLDTIP